MKRLTLMLLTLATGVASAAFVPPARVHCTVDDINPPNASFFGTALRPPRKGDTIDIDFSKNEIDELKFSSGGQIPLKQAKAKLVKIEPSGQPDPSSSYYEGKAKSATSDYLGLLQAYHDDKQSYVVIQVLRKLFFGEMAIHTLRMTCSRVN